MTFSDTRTCIIYSLQSYSTCHYRASGGRHWWDNWDSIDCFKMNCSLSSTWRRWRRIHGSGIGRKITFATHVLNIICASQLSSCISVLVNRGRFHRLVFSYWSGSIPLSKGMASFRWNLKSNGSIPCLSGVSSRVSSKSSLHSGSCGCTTSRARDRAGQFKLAELAEVTKYVENQTNLHKHYLRLFAERLDK